MSTIERGRDRILCTTQRMPLKSRGCPVKTAYDPICVSYSRRHAKMTIFYSLAYWYVFVRVYACLRKNKTARGGKAAMRRVRVSRTCQTVRELIDV